MNNFEIACSMSSFHTSLILTSSSSSPLSPSCSPRPPLPPPPESIFFKDAIDCNSSSVALPRSSFSLRDKTRLNERLKEIIFAICPLPFDDRSFHNTETSSFRALVLGDRGEETSGKNSFSASSLTKSSNMELNSPKSSVPESSTSNALNTERICALESTSKFGMFRMAFVNSFESMEPEPSTSIFSNAEDKFFASVISACRSSSKTSSCHSRQPDFSLGVYRAKNSGNFTYTFLNDEEDAFSRASIDCVFFLGFMENKPPVMTSFALTNIGNIFFHCERSFNTVCKPSAHCSRVILPFPLMSMLDQWSNNSLLYSMMYSLACIAAICKARFLSPFLR